jgi:NAD-reducing hydrogenase small subunit
MSFLDMDETLANLHGRMELVYSPLVDVHEIPEGIDVALVEGAVSNTDNVETILQLRDRSRILVAFGDCAVTANVPGMRNRFDPEVVLARAYTDNETDDHRVPGEDIPRLMRRVRPLHEFVRVDAFLPGCPPPAEAIVFLVTSFLEGRLPDLTGWSHFGA